MSKRVQNFSTDPSAGDGLSLTLDYEEGDKDTVTIPQEILPVLLGQLLAETQRVKDDEAETQNALRVENVQFGTAQQDGKDYIALRFKVQGGAQLLTILPREGANVLSRELGRHIKGN